MPVLTPIGLDPAHPFPRVLNKSLNFAVELEGQGRVRPQFGHGHRAGAARAAARDPAAARRSRLPSTTSCSCPPSCTRTSAELFAGMKVLGCYQFRVTRNSDLFVDEEEVKDLRTALQGELPQRHFGDAVRLEVADNCPPGHGGVPAAAVRAGRGRPVPRRRPGQPGAADAASPTRSTGPISSFRRSRPACRRMLQPSATTCSTRCARATSCCTTRTSRSSR